MIGIGMLGTSHPHAGGKLRVLQASPEFEVVGVAEPDPAGAVRPRDAELFAAARRVPMDMLLEDRSIAAVVVEGRVQENLRWARLALEAGKHVHLEKPAGDSLPEFRAVLEVARKQDLLLQMGYQFRYNGGFDLVRRAVSQGWIGDVFYIHGSIGSEIAPVQRARLAAFAGGMMFELGSHLIDTLVGLLGRPHTITPFTRHDGSHADGLADNTVAVFQFERAMAVLESSAMEVEGFKRRQLEVCGTEGSVVVQPIEPATARICLRRPWGAYQAGWQSVPVENVPRYVRDFEEFAACIRGDRTPAYGYEHDETVQEAVLRASGVEM